MKVIGSAVLNAPRDQVWSALNDPSVLVRTIPGCERLEEIGPNAYRMTINAGVASIKGTYQGEVLLADQLPPGSFILKASGAGAPGTVSADVKVTLSEDGPQTRLDYDADAIVGGMIGGVGQRMLVGVAKKTANEFFAAVDEVLTGKAAPLEMPAAEEIRPPAAAAEAAAAAPGVYVAPRPPTAPGAGVLGGDFGRGVLVGAVVALLGALVGGWVAGRRRG